MDLATGAFIVVDGGTGGDCQRYNRLRRTCHGIIRPSLFSAVGFSVRELGAAKALGRAIAEKPQTGSGRPSDDAPRPGGIRSIGG